MNAYSLILVILTLLLGLLSDYKCSSEKISPCVEGATNDMCLQFHRSSAGNDIEWKRKMAKKYLSTLEDQDRENWLDPTDMLHFKGFDELDYDLPKIPSKDNKNTPTNVDINSRSLNENSGEKVASRALTVTGNKEHVSQDSIVQSEEMFKLTAEVKKAACSLNDIYLTRWLKKMLIQIESSFTWGGEGMSYIQFPITTKLASTLSETIKKQPLNVQELDNILSDAISGSTIVQNAHILEQSLNIFYLYKTEMIVIFTILFLLMSFSLIVRCQKLTLFGLFVAICVFWHWMDLYQQKLAEKQFQLESVDYQADCMKKDLSTLQRISFYFKSFFIDQTDCKKYYKALVIDPIWEVSLSVAVSETISSCFLQPLKVSARVANYCIKELFSGLNILLTTMLIVFIFFILLMFCNYRIRLPWFFATLEPVNKTSQVQDVPETQMKSQTLGGVRQIMHYLHIVKSTDFDHVEEIVEKAKTCTQGESLIDSEFKQKSNCQLLKSSASFDNKIPKRGFHTRSRSFCGVMDKDVALIQRLLEKNNCIPIKRSN